MQSITVLVLLLMWCTQTVHAQQGIGLTLNNVQYTNNSVVNITDIGTGSAALRCTTTFRPCCFSFPPPGNHWYFPNGSRVDRFNTLLYYRTRMDGWLSPPGAILLHRNPLGVTTGVFRCEILNATGAFQSIYVGIYNATTGSPHVTNIGYNSLSNSLTCTSTGGPATTVIWRKDGAVITLNSTHQQTKRVVDPVASTYQTVLAIDPSVDQGSIVGSYCCTVENVRGRSSLVVIVGALNVTFIRDAGAPTAGQSLNLTCTAILNGTIGSPTIDWLSPNNTPISNNSNFTVENMIMVNNSAYERTLVFSSVHTSHGGQYTCRAVLDQASAMASTELSVKIPQPTVSITPNYTGVLHAGTPLTLTCSIQLNPAVDTTVMVTRMWRGPRSQTVSNSSRVTVSNLFKRPTFIYETTIEFIPVSISDSGNYECEATVTPDPQSQFVIMSTAGSDTHPVTVQALPVPEVAINSTGNTTAGEVYTLSCTATVVENLVVVPTIQWEYSNGSAVEGGSTFTLSDMVTSGNTTTRNLTFSPLRTSHGGQYTCRAIINIPPISISGLNSSQPYPVMVRIPPPSVNVTNSSATYAGTNFNLTCTIELNTAVDTPVVVNSTWHGPLGIPTGTRVIASEPIGTGARYQTTLMFRPLNTSDSGHYTCEATVSPSPESQFIITSRTGRVTLRIDVQALPHPEVTIHPDGSTTAGAVHTLTCNATIVKNLAVRPDIEWLYSNGTIVGGSNSTLGTIMMTNNVFTRNLTFNPLRTSDGGQYICSTSINVSSISLKGISSESSLNVTVQIPANATISRMPPTHDLSTGINLTLICTIQLNTAVDTDVVVNTSWTGPTAMFASNSQGRISVTSLTGSIPLYETRVFFSPLNITDSGTYVCQADVRADSSSPFIVMNRDTVTHTINVEGLVAPVVMVTLKGDPTAGNTYTLVCQVSVVEGLVVDPDVDWLDSYGTPVSGLDITVGRPNIEGSVVTRNLTFSHLHTSHGGNYTCRASISVSSILLSSSNLTRITVRIPQPTVNVISNHTGILHAGTPLTLTCSIQLNPAVDTTVMVARMWRVPGSQVVSNSSRVTVSNILKRSALLYETTIEFIHLNTTDSGNYECEATVTPDIQSQFVNRSTAGSDTYTVTVQDLPVPEVAIHVTGNTTAGEMYTLSCTAAVVENLVVVPTIQWEYSNGSAVEGGSTFTLSAMVTSGNTTTHNLTFSPLRTSHGGKYTCRAIINIPSIPISGLNRSQSIGVVIQIPAPTIHITTMQPTYNGTNVTLTCTIRLNTAVNTEVNVSGTWLNSTYVLTTSNTTCITVSDTRGIEHLTYQTLLQFEPLGNHSRDGGSYVCEASVTPFSMPQYIRNISNNGLYFLRVAALPLPNVQFTPTTFAITGQSYSLTCTVQVVQYLAVTPDVTWLAPDGSSLGNVNGITMREAVENGNVTTLRFTVDRLAESHTGNYTCRACISIPKVAIEGHCGHVVAEVTLSVPGRVQELQLMSLSDHSVSVLWREPVSTNGAIVNYTVQVRRYRPASESSRALELVAVDPEFNRNIFTTTLRLSSDGMFMINISEGLEPLIPYNVTVVAVNLAGPGEKETTNFFTRQGAPSIAPGNVEVIRLNGTAMNVSWVPLNLIEARGFVQSYIIAYQQASTGSRPKRQVQTQQVDGRASSTIVGGLQPGVAYEVSIAGMTTENGPVSSPTQVSSVPTPSSALFQLQLSGLPSTCRTWVVSGTSAKLSDVRNAVVQNTERLCQCGFNVEHITEEAFQCFPNSDQQVTFRARLHETVHATSVQLIQDIEVWINRGTSIAVQGVRVNVDICPVVISFFEDPQCLDEMLQPTTPSEMMPSTSMETSSDSITTETAVLDNTDNTAAIVGGVVAVMIVLILAMTFIVIAVLMTKNRKYKYSTNQNLGKQPTKWSEVAESPTAAITTTRCEAYELTKLGQEYEVVPEPEYDVIPAFAGEQQIQEQQEYENITAQPAPTLPETSGRVED